MKYLTILLFAFAAFSCTSRKDNKAEEKKPVVVSLLGKEYFEPERSAKAQAKLDSNLAVAISNWEKDPSEENYIWYGRRLGYLSRFQESIDILTKGIAKYPASVKLYRHRGHRFISTRQFDNAVADLRKAKEMMPESPLEIEPDGSPNKLNIPLSSTQFNVLYHLALAHYLKGEFEAARQIYDLCMMTCDNDDLLVATVDWAYMTDMRMGRDEEARKILDKVSDKMNIIENDSYYKRCQMYQGKLTPASLLEVGDEEDKDLSLATQGYGVGNWYYYNGDSTKARDIFEKVVAGKHFSSFGFIAAEAELARWKK